MQSTARDVTTYIQEAPVERQQALRRLRQLCRATLTGFEESMDYGGPCYKRNGEVDVGFASQKHFTRRGTVEDADDSSIYLSNKKTLRERVDAELDRLSGRSFLGRKT